MNFGQIDRDGDVPPFAQIADALRRAITSRQLASGERLPTEGKLAEHFGVARMTVRRAVRELRDEGLLVAASGRGLTVRPASRSREERPHEPGSPPEATPQAFKAWGDAAPLIAQAENIRTRLYALAGDLSELGLLVELRQELDTARRDLELSRTQHQAETAALRTELDVLRTTHTEQLAQVQRNADDRVTVLTDALNAAREMLRLTIPTTPTIPGEQ